MPKQKSTPVKKALKKTTRVKKTQKSNGETISSLKKTYDYKKLPKSVKKSKMTKGELIDVIDKNSKNLTVSDMCQNLISVIESKVQCDFGAEDEVAKYGQIQIESMDTVFLSMVIKHTRRACYGPEIALDYDTFELSKTPRRMKLLRVLAGDNTCDTNKYTFIVHPLNIRDASSTSSHANMVFINTRQKTVELFEPNGSGSRFSNTLARDLNDLMCTGKNAIYPGYTFIHPDEYCPLGLGPQAIYGGEGGGYCNIYSILYTWMRINCPESTREQITYYLISMPRYRLKKLVSNWICYVYGMTYNSPYIHLYREMYKYFEDVRKSHSGASLEKLNTFATLYLEAVRTCTIDLNLTKAKSLFAKAKSIISN
jgi:hypothetical protein